MLRATRPFDRWFDLSDSYDDIRAPVRGSKRKPEAPREWTYAPTRPEPNREPQQEPRPGGEPRPSR